MSFAHLNAIISGYYLYISPLTLSSLYHKYENELEKHFFPVSATAMGGIKRVNWEENLLATNVCC